MTYRKQRPRLRYSEEMAQRAMQEMRGADLEALENLIRQAYFRDLDQTKAALRDYAVLRHRARIKAGRDTRTDVRRRTLVGARLPRETAERVRLAAWMTGRSVYRFVADAIARELDRYSDEYA